MKKWTQDDIPDQTGKNFIITGANSGLGLASTVALARKGAKIIMACRSVVRGKQAGTALLDQVPDAEFEIRELDLASLQSIRDFSSTVSAAYDRIDVLINNAGIMAVPYGTTSDGFELQFGTNHLGHFALTGLIIPLIRKAPGGRIVTVSSLAARGGEINFGDLMSEQKYSPWKAYKQSKLANQLFAFELQRRLDKVDSKMTSVAAHPGIVATNLHKAMKAKPVFKKLAEISFYKIVSGPDHGALPQLFAATSGQVTGGEYYGPGGFKEYSGNPGKARIAGAAENKETAEELWRISEDLTGIRFDI